MPSRTSPSARSAATVPNAAAETARPLAPPGPAAGRGSAGRRPFLDWLRIGAFALLVPYHVGMLYVSWDWHLKSPTPLPALEPWLLLTNPWRMSLLYLVSGAATLWMLRRRPQGLLRERARRLLLPLLAGMALVVPPQAYFQVVTQGGYGGGYGEFLALYFSGYGGFCRDGECLLLPTWNHLWFLPYLFLHTALAVGAYHGLGPRRRQALADRAAALPAWAWWAGPVLWLALLRLGPFGAFGQSNAFVDDPYGHASGLTLFALGMLLAARPALFARLERLRWTTLAVALACWAGIVAYHAHVASLPAVPEGLRAAQRVAWAAQQWSAVVALLGFAHRHLDRDHRWRSALNEAVFPLYLLHQTLIIVFAMALRPWALGPALEGPLLVLGTFAAALLAWRLLRWSGPLRPWFGLQRRQRDAAARPAS